MPLERGPPGRTVLGMTEDVHHAVHPATAGDVDRLARTLAAAFADDPLVCHLLPPAVRRREERVRRAFAIDGARSLELGTLWTTADGDAAAVWFPPGHWRPTPRQDLRELPAWLRLVLDRCDAAAVPAYLESTCVRSVRLYRRHGFVEHGTVDLPAGHPPVTPMWRDPR